MHWWRSGFQFAVLVLSLWLTGGGAALAADIKVTVTGEGPTVSAAKDDAVRQALQLALKQLVVVDRVVSGNSVLRDKVMSTMNGYVERYEERSVTRTATGVRVVADITISSSRIENFIGVASTPEGDVDIAPIFSEVNRRNAQVAAERGQVRARGEIFDRLLRGFPSGAAELRLKEITLDPKEADLLNIKLEFSYKPEFKNALEGTVRALSWFECKGLRLERGGGALAMYGRTVVAAVMQLSTWASDQVRLCRGPRISDVAAGLASGRIQPTDQTYSDLVCLTYSDRTDCYGLAPGNYCAECRLDLFSNIDGVQNGVVAFGRFLDAAGASANAGGPCIAALGYLGEPVEAGAAKLNKSKYFLERDKPPLPTYFTAAFDFRSSTIVIQVRASQVDMRRAKSFVAVAGFAPGRVSNPMLNESNQNWSPSSDRHWFTNLVPEVGRAAQAGCELLDQAVRYRAVETH